MKENLRLQKEKAVTAYMQQVANGLSCIEFSAGVEPAALQDADPSLEVMYKFIIEKDDLPVLLSEMNVVGLRKAEVSLCNDYYEAVVKVNFFEKSESLLCQHVNAKASIMTNTIYPKLCDILKKEFVEDEGASIRSYIPGRFI